MTSQRHTVGFLGGGGAWTAQLKIIRDKILNKNQC